MFKGFTGATIALALIVTLTACGEGGGSTASPPPPTPPPVATDKWAAVKAEFDAFSVPNAALIIGSKTGGVRVRYE